MIYLLILLPGSARDKTNTPMTTRAQRVCVGFDRKNATAGPAEATDKLRGPTDCNMD